MDVVIIEGSGKNLITIINIRRNEIFKRLDIFLIISISEREG
jgi:hypothetical protein